jgi:hypothetical protein
MSDNDEMSEPRTRVPRPNDQASDLGYKSEKIHQLAKSRAGYIGVITKVYKEISDMIAYNKCNVGDISLKLNKFDQAWCEFVGVLEKYLVQLIEHETEKESACVSYEEQRKRKMNLDAMVTEWRHKAKIELHDATGSRSAKSKHSKSMRSGASSSKASSIVRKREEMALARMKVEHLKIRQQFEIQEQEVRRKRELAEAEMEANMAVVSYEIFQENEGSISESKELGKYISPYDVQNTNEPIELVLMKDKESKHSYKSERQSCEVLTERGFQHKGFRSASEIHESNSRKPLVQEGQSQPSLQYQGLPILDHNSASGLRETGTLPFGLPAARSQELLPNLAARAPVTNGSENRENPDTLLQCVSQPTTNGGLPHPYPPPLAATAGSHYPHQINLNDSNIPSHQQGYALPTESNQPVGDHIGNNRISPTDEIARALRQVVNMPKIEYLHFNGDPLKFGAFMHNFENCLERDDPDDSRKLQLLIQHCTGKAREAIESCVNLAASDGYRVAKETLHEHFGKPHVIAMAHIKKLVDLPSLKSGDGQSLLEFSRHLNTAERTLKGMGSSYTSDLNHMNTLRELAKKLPMYLRARWTEKAGSIIEEGRKPEFGDFQKFVQQRAKLVNNEFGTDMAVSARTKANRSEGTWKRREENNKNNGISSFAAGSNGDQVNRGRQPSSCEACSGPHRVWRCDTFKKMELNERQRIVLRRGLCNKCLVRGHIAKNCPKTNFKCRIAECGAKHHTLLHHTKGAVTERDKMEQKEVKSRTRNEDGAGDSVQQVNGEPNGSVAATRAGEKRVCLGVIPVRVRGHNSTHEVETYALLDNGSEVTLCHERLMETLGLDGDKLKFTLTGINGTTEVEGQSINIVVESLDGSTAVELSKVKTVKQMPVSKGCRPKKIDLERWPHLKNIEIPELVDGEVLLLIGLKERPRLFLPLEVREGGDEEPIAIRYSLGWTVMGPVGGAKETRDCLVNFARTKNVNSGLGMNNDFGTKENPSGNVTIKDIDKGEDVYNEIGLENCMFVDQRVTNEDDLLRRQLERLWNTDFNESTVRSNESNLSVEDKRAVEIMEQTLKRKDGHFQVALPW